MAQQIKLDDETKKEIELYAALTGLNQKEIVAASWREFKHNHREEFHKGLAWAESILAVPGAAAVAASGIPAAEIAEIAAAFNDGAPSERSAVSAASSHD